MNQAVSSPSAGQEGSAGEIFNRMRQAYLEQPLISYDQRVEILKTMEKILLENDAEICDAVSQDFGNRSIHETQILEIATTVMGIRHTLKCLRKWMRPQRRKVSLVFFGGKNTLIPQAKGIVGIVTPWNYPLQLALCPMTDAIASGNRVMLKMASNSQNLCRLLHKLFSEKIPADIISVMPGVPASEFSSLPFNHMVFTGSPEVGRTVMKTASASLTPVTLELGGKSPTILAEDFDINLAAARIIYGKLINSGQTCVAPDYLFVPESKKDAFIQAAQKIATERYPNVETKDLTSIIDERAYQRLTDTIEDAKQKGAEIIPMIKGAENVPGLKKLVPVIVTNVTDDMIVMQDEIFGPLLPIMTYKNIDEVISYINQHERPLALYLYTNNGGLQQKMVTNTISGGVTINDCAMHVAQHDMPFGGVGNSGLGQYHGYEGFLEMSKMRPVYKQPGFALSLAPPYGKFFNRIYDSIKKYRFIH